MVQDTNQQPTRRSLMRKTGGITAAVALGGCIGGSNSAGDSSGNNSAGGSSGNNSNNGQANKPNSLTFGTWGGSWQDTCQEAAIDPFKQETGINMNYQVGPEAQRFQKGVVQKKNPPFDNAQFPNEFLVRGQNQGLWHSLDSDILPIYDKVSDKFKGDSWIAQHFTGSALVYNTNTFSDPPEDMGVFLDTAYKGRIGLALPSERSPAFDLMAFSLYETNGDSYKDIDAAFEMYKEIVDTMDPTFLGSTDEYAKAFQDGSIDITRVWAARSASWRADGIPLSYTLPPNGSMLYGAGHAIPKNIPENKLKWSGQLTQNFFTPKASKSFANQQYYLTTNPDVNYSEEITKRVPTLDNLDKLILPDYEWLAKNRPDWTTRASEIIQG